MVSYIKYSENDKIKTKAKKVIMNLLSRFLNRTDFTDYDDFAKNVRFSVPENFNFGYDVVDEYARLAPEKRALVWCNSAGEEKIMTFRDISEASNRTVNFLISAGVKKGDYVMSMLNRRWEYWVLVTACCKLGAVIIPATHLLTAKDIVYRCNSAEVKILVATAEEDVIEHISHALPKCETLKECLFTKPVEGFRCFDDCVGKMSAELPSLPRPAWNDPMLCYFTSGTTGMPKMVQHNFEYPAGFVFNACFWQKSWTTGFISPPPKRAGQNAAGARFTDNGLRAAPCSPTTTTADSPPPTCSLSSRNTKSRHSACRPRYTASS